MTSEDDQDGIPAPEASPAVTVPAADAGSQRPSGASVKRFVGSRRFRAFISCYTVFVAVGCVGWLVFAPGDSKANFLVGFLLGAGIAAVLMTARLWRDHHRAVS